MSITHRSDPKSDKNFSQPAKISKKSRHPLPSPDKPKPVPTPTPKPPKIKLPQGLVVTEEDQLIRFDQLGGLDETIRILADAIRQEPVELDRKDWAIWRDGKLVAVVRPDVRVPGAHVIRVEEQEWENVDHSLLVNGGEFGVAIIGWLIEAWRLAKLREDTFQARWKTSEDHAEKDDPGRSRWGHKETGNRWLNFLSHATVQAEWALFAAIQSACRGELVTVDDLADESKEFGPAVFDYRGMIYLALPHDEDVGCRVVIPGASFSCDSMLEAE